MSNFQEVIEVPPTFLSSIETQPPPIYFHHVIDTETATLKVMVLGANLTFTFAHKRALKVARPSQIAKQLENKTTGFLALVTRSRERVVLVAAESGHGAGRFGDLLDPQKGVLRNDIWTRRVIAFGKTLGLRMNRPFDGMGRAAVARVDGVFLGSHVEVKLAVHGICVLLSMFGITKDYDNITVEQLRQLRTTRWEDGSRPIFEVYFSRKHCHPCRSLVQKLSEMTGVPIRLLWKHRLIPKTYAVTCKPIGPHRARDGPEPEVMVCDSQDMDFGDELSDAETISDGELETIDTIDLTEVDRSEQIEAYINGLAYRVGQMRESPEGVTAAIVEFTATVKRQKQKTADIPKPLPATPVIEGPALARERHTWPPARRTFFHDSQTRNGRAKSSSPSIGRGRVAKQKAPRRFNMKVPETIVLDRDSEPPRRKSRSKSKGRQRPTRAFY
ncbi:hypothetical protein LCI18_014224 [Fusarium solani-melongenae]|uniref:Uncharacterized protein n=1 Tax=Fusarium solani subsp. cucurbitae TaxID=2747967 RepID=A0ACD3ZPP0_FUSSC|nr:hypothetical protein LCI18_014224 [Fusarium solani-melongenae]